MADEFETKFVSGFTKAALKSKGNSYEKKSLGKYLAPEGTATEAKPRVEAVGKQISDLFKTIGNGKEVNLTDLAHQVGVAEHRGHLIHGLKGGEDLDTLSLFDQAKVAPRSGDEYRERGREILSGLSGIIKDPSGKNTKDSEFFLSENGKPILEHKLKKVWNPATRQSESEHSFVSNHTEDAPQIPHEGNASYNPSKHQFDLTTYKKHVNPTTEALEQTTSTPEGAALAAQAKQTRENYQFNLDPEMLKHPDIQEHLPQELQDKIREGAPQVNSFTLASTGRPFPDREDNALHPQMGGLAKGLVSYEPVEAGPNYRSRLETNLEELAEDYPWAHPDKLQQQSLDTNPPDLTREAKDEEGIPTGERELDPDAVNAYSKAMAYSNHAWADKPFDPNQKVKTGAEADVRFNGGLQASLASRQITPETREVTGLHDDSKSGRKIGNLTIDNVLRLVGKGSLAEDNISESDQRFVADVGKHIPEASKQTLTAFVQATESNPKAKKWFAKLLKGASQFQDLYGKEGATISSETRDGIREHLAKNDDLFTEYEQKALEVEQSHSKSEAWQRKLKEEHGITPASEKEAARKGLLGKYADENGEVPREKQAEYRAERKALNEKYADEYRTEEERAHLKAKATNIAEKKANRESVTGKVEDAKEQLSKDYQKLRGDTFFPDDGNVKQARARLDEFKADQGEALKDVRAEAKAETKTTHTDAQLKELETNAIQAAKDRRKLLKTERNESRAAELKALGLTKASETANEKIKNVANILPKVAASVAEHTVPALRAMRQRMENLHEIHREAGARWMPIANHEGQVRYLGHDRPRDIPEKNPDGSNKKDIKGNTVYQRNRGQLREHNLKMGETRETGLQPKSEGDSTFRKAMPTMMQSIESGVDDYAQTVSGGHHGIFDARQAAGAHLDKTVDAINEGHLRLFQNADKMWAQNFGFARDAIRRGLSEDKIDQAKARELNKRLIQEVRGYVGRQTHPVKGPDKSGLVELHEGIKKIVHFEDGGLVS